MTPDYYTISYSDTTTSTSTSSTNYDVAYYVDYDRDSPYVSISDLVKQSEDEKQFRRDSERAYQLQQMIILSLLLTQTYDKIVVIRNRYYRRCSMTLKTFMNLRF